MSISQVARHFANAQFLSSRMIALTIANWPQPPYICRATADAVYLPPAPTTGERHWRRCAVRQWYILLDGQGTPEKPLVLAYASLTAMEELPDRYLYNHAGRDGFHFMLVSRARDIPEGYRPVSFQDLIFESMRRGQAVLERERL
jgi:hypothetical protein